MIIIATIPSQTLFRFSSENYYDMLKTHYMRDKYLIILDLLRAHLIRSRLIGQALDTKLKLNQLYLLLEISKNLNITLTELGKRLSLNKSSISRELVRLQKLKLVKVNKDLSDQRRLYFEILPEGKEVLLKYYDFNNEKVKDLSQCLNQKERKYFIEYLEVFAGIKKNLHVKYSERVRLAFTALTRKHGVESSSYLASGYDSQTWVFLSEIHYGCLYAFELSNILGLKKDRVSKILTKLKASKLIVSKKESAFEKLILTKQGLDALGQIESAAKATFAFELKSLDSRKLNTFIDLLGLYTIALPGNLLVLNNSYGLISCKQSEDYVRLRELFLANQEWHLSNYPLAKVASFFSEKN